MRRRRGSDARASALAKRMIWHPCMCLRQDPRKRDLQWNWHVKNWNARNAKRNRRRVLSRLSMNKEEPSKCVMSELVDNNNCARDPRSGWYLRRPNRPVGEVLLSLVSITHGGSQCGPKSSALWTDWSPHKRYNWKKLVRGISNLKVDDLCTRVLYVKRKDEDSLIWNVANVVSDRFVSIFFLSIEN